MWELLTEESRERVGEAGFIDRLPLIAAEMSLVSLEAVPGEPERPRLPDGSPDPGRATVPLDVTFETRLVGTFSRSTELRLVLVGEEEEAAWRIEWSPDAILPELTPGRLVRMTRLPTSRGRILARDGTELATFVEAGVVGVVPRHVADEDAMLASLAAALGMEVEDVRARYDQPWVQPHHFVPIRTLLPAELEAARPRLAVIEGVVLRSERVRSYPTGLAAQTIGYVGEASAEEAERRAARGVQPGDVIGRTGLEATLDDALGGAYGWRLSVVEPSEQPVVTLAETAPVAGLDAVLSLDATLQRAAEETLGEHRGAVVAQDPWTGEVLVIASRPSFDLDVFVTGDPATIAALNEHPDRPLFNRATFGQYATGSSFKMVTASAALRHGLYTWGQRIDCPVRWTGYGEQWAQLNHETGDLGAIDLELALTRSCNTFFYELGKRLNDRDPDLLPDAAKSFGLGAATEIEFVFEDEGVVPSPDWKRAVLGEPWNPGDATNLAIGQGFLLATPIQMANYASALANDGIVWRPRLVVELRDRAGGAARELPMERLGQADAANTELSLIRDGMRSVVADPRGTVHSVFRGSAVSAAGKSGTAETSVEGRVNAWFVGFAPFEAPSIAIAVVFEQFEETEERHGSLDAARVARAVFEAHAAR